MSLGSIDFLRSEMGRDSIAHSCTVVAVDYSTLVKELGTMSKQAKVSNALGDRNCGNVNIRDIGRKKITSP